MRREARHSFSCTLFERCARSKEPNKPPSRGGIAAAAPVSAVRGAPSQLQGRMWLRRSDATHAHATSHASARARTTATWSSAHGRRHVIRALRHAGIGAQSRPSSHQSSGTGLRRHGLAKRNHSGASRRRCGAEAHGDAFAVVSLVHARASRCALRPHPRRPRRPRGRSPVARHIRAAAPRESIGLKPITAPEAGTMGCRRPAAPRRADDLRSNAPREARPPAAPRSPQQLHAW